MTSIVGQYDCKADAKGRINLPTSLKNKLLPYMNDEFVIKRSVFKECLELHPKVKFDEVMQKVMKKGGRGKQFELFLMKFTAGLKEVPIDADTGRLQIPKNLFDFAGLAKEVVLNAQHDKIEIWDKDKYEGVLESMSDAEYEAMAENIFDVDE
ncbi:division/cell wall cluster transcriptional repressor MraZ [Maribacter sp. 2304DJ31-5]|uniref:division/cell wall cluster transcriptional repressor MraZ n=1 Tax=Maribacter sp. 2304DJ31-5 TaxID=3386273 RepID=UPI0039BC679C